MASLAGRVAHLERTIEDMQAGMDVMQRRMGDLEALVQQLQQQLPAGKFLSIGLAVDSLTGHSISQFRAGCGR